MEEKETTEKREIEAVPDYLWKAAEYIESMGADDVADLLCRYLRSHDPLQIPHSSDMQVTF